MDPVEEGRLVEKVETMTKNLEELEGEIQLLVTRVEFTPVKLIAYGMVGMILSTVVAQLLTLVIAKW